MYSTLFISTLLLNGAYIWPAYVACLVFVYLVPLFYGVLKHHTMFSFTQGFIWGILFFSIHFIALAKILIDYNSFIAALVMYSILIAYFSLYSALWFGVATMLSVYLPTMVAWVCATVMYIFFLDTYSLWIFGILQGYPLAHPLIPLASYPRLLQLIPLFGRYGLLFFLLCVSSGITNFLRREWITGALCLGIGSVPFLYGAFTTYTIHIPPYISSCAVITPPINTDCKLDVIQEIAYKIAYVKKVKPVIQIFLMPESCYPFALNNDQEMIKVWYQGLPDEVLLIIGAHRQEGKKLFNTIYCIQDSRIIHFYDKKYLFPFTEYTPSTWNEIGYNPFLTKKEPFCAGIHTNDAFEAIQAYPLICCEIFFNPMSRQLPGKIILLCVNESWFINYMSDLMYLRAIMIALEYRVSIIWVGHKYGAFIDKSGFQLPFFTI